jgi:DNA-binding Xre family transcriptional regulator
MSRELCKILYFFSLLSDKISIIINMGGMEIMGISYNPLFKLLIDRGMKKTDLCEKVGLSLGTVAKFSKGETVDGKIIARLCEYFDCQPGDIMEYVKEVSRGGK